MLLNGIRMVNKKKVASHKSQMAGVLCSWNEDRFKDLWDFKWDEDVEIVKANWSLWVCDWSWCQFLQRLLDWCQFHKPLIKCLKEQFFYLLEPYFRLSTKFYQFFFSEYSFHVCKKIPPRLFLSALKWN